MTTMRNYTARCAVEGCESPALPNPADTENGPCAADLDPVLCPYHEAEFTLVSYIDADIRNDLGLNPWGPEDGEREKVQPRCEWVVTMDDGSKWGLVARGSEQAREKALAAAVRFGGRVDPHAQIVQTRDQFNAAEHAALVRDLAGLGVYLVGSVTL